MEQLIKQMEIIKSNVSMKFENLKLFKRFYLAYTELHQAVLHFVDTSNTLISGIVQLPSAQLKSRDEILAKAILFWKYFGPPAKAGGNSKAGGNISFANSSGNSKAGGNISFANSSIATGHPAKAGGNSSANSSIATGFNLWNLWINKIFPFVGFSQNLFINFN